jgi:hypothetical protein
VSGLCACGAQKSVSPGKIGEAGTCERPRRIHCHGCRSWVSVRCNSGSRARCGPCSTLKRGDISAVCRSGWVGQLAASCLVFLTLTAPGADVLEWDVAKCMHEPSRRPCSGRRGCVATADSLARWNTGLAKRWSYFRMVVKRHLPAGADMTMCKSWELQKRGALHVHAMLRFEGCTFAEAEAALEWYRAHYGWGTEMKVDPVPVRDERQIARRAGYIAKYCSKGYDDLQDVPTIVNGLVQCCRMSPFSKSRGWGLTLAECYHRRVDWWASAGVRLAPASSAPAPPAAAGRLDPYTESSTNVKWGSALDGLAGGLTV